MKVTTIGNRMIDEKIYVDAMCGRFLNHHFLFDTGRNGWGPQVEPMAGVDAFVWIKPTGASDGTRDASHATDTEGKRFDPMCGADLVVCEKGQAVATDALSDAPAAGKWFDEQFFMLARNATPAQ